VKTEFFGKNWLYMILLLLTLVTMLAIMSLDSGGGLLGTKKDEIELVFYVDKTLLPLFEEVEKRYIPLLEEKEGVSIRITYTAGSSGAVLARLNISNRGDVYGSDDIVFAKLAVEQGLVYGDGVRIIGYITLAILLPKNSDLNISGLSDLVNYPSRLRIAIGDPSHVAAGKLVVEILSENGFYDKLLDNHDVVLGQSASDVANMVASGAVDAGITFDVFYYNKPDSFKMVPIEPELNKRAAPIVVAVSTKSENPHIAEEIVKYMASDIFSEVVRKLGFKTREDVLSKYPYMRVPDEHDILNDK